MFFLLFLYVFVVKITILSSPVDYQKSILFNRINQNKLENIIRREIKLTTEECFALETHSIELDPIELIVLGYCFQLDIGVEKNLIKAFINFKKSADQNNSYGQFQLGLCYIDGHGVDRNITKAFENFEKSADQGNIDGQNFIGFCYENGVGVIKNLTKAFINYKKSADQGNSEGQYAVGLFYEKGFGVEKNL